MRKILLGLFLFMLVSSPVFAKSCWRYESGYGAQAGGKFLFGLKNALTGWTEILSGPYYKIHDAPGFTEGVGEGLFHFANYTIFGVLDVATFPIPALDFPMHRGGVQCKCCQKPVLPEPAPPAAPFKEPKAAEVIVSEKPAGAAPASEPAAEAAAEEASAPKP